MDTNTAAKNQHQHNQKSEELLGPQISVAWVRAAAELGRSPSCVRVGIALWMQAGDSQELESEVSYWLLDSFGRGRKTGLRAVCRLESAGLIQISRTPGKCSEISINQLGGA